LHVAQFELQIKTHVPITEEAYPDAHTVQFVEIPEHPLQLASHLRHVAFDK
jgi:hypothetical protein